MSTITSALLSLALAGATSVPALASPVDCGCTPTYCNYCDPTFTIIRAQLGLTLATALTGGVEIISIDDPNGVGASSGLQVGDTILTANGVPVNSVSALVNVVAAARGVVGINHGVVILAVRDVNPPHDIVQLAFIIP